MNSNRVIEGVFLLAAGLFSIFFPGLFVPIGTTESMNRVAGLVIAFGGIVIVVFGLIAKPSEKHLVPISRTVTPTMEPALTRPTGLVIMSVLWFLGGAYNSIVGLANLVADLNVISVFARGYHFINPEINSYLQLAAPLEAILMFVVVMLGMMQFATIYGFLKGKTWAHRSGIAIPIIATITSWSHVFLALTAPPSLGVSANFVFPVFNIIFALVYIPYLQRANVKKWLRVD